MTLSWRIYYSDGTTFDSSQGRPEDAPAWGVQCIIQTCPDEGKNLTTRHDFYWRDEGRWVGGDFIGLVDALARNCTCVRFGRWMPAQRFEMIDRLANEDKDFVTESGMWRANGGDAGAGGENWNG